MTQILYRLATLLMIIGSWGLVFLMAWVIGILFRLVYESFMAGWTF